MNEWITVKEHRGYNIQVLNNTVVGDSMDYKIDPPLLGYELNRVSFACVVEAIETIDIVKNNVNYRDIKKKFKNDNRFPKLVETLEDAFAAGSKDIDKLPLLKAIIQVAKESVCSHEECSRPSEVTGLCAYHYSKSRTKKNVSRPIINRSMPTHCIIDGCGRKHKSRGLCILHYSRIFTTGISPNDLTRINKSNLRWSDSDPFTEEKRDILNQLKPLHHVSLNTEHCIKLKERFSYLEDLQAEIREANRKKSIRDYHNILKNHSEFGWMANAPAWDPGEGRGEL